MRKVIVVRGVIALICCTVFSVALYADNQTIYRCKDKAGRFVFQQYACSEDGISDRSPAYPVWRDLRIQSAQAKKTLAALGADVESIKQCQRAMKQYQQQLSTHRSKLQSLARDYEELVKAFGLLQECGECRSSAISNCQLADQQLEAVMGKLMEY